MHGRAALADSADGGRGFTREALREGSCVACGRGLEPTIAVMTKRLTNYRWLRYPETGR